MTGLQGFVPDGRAIPDRPYALRERHVADDLKLYRVDVETEVYCVASSETEAMEVARRHFADEEPALSAKVATYVEGDWDEGLPYHARKDLPDRTCSEWFTILNKPPSDT